LADTSAPGRLFQALKTFLGDPLDTRTNVFGGAKGLEDLIALILVHVRNRAEELTGAAPNAITLGRPVRFIGGDDAEAHATGRLRAAAKLAGFRDVRFVAEPIAAAHAADVGPGTSLVFDFGGGTLDLCVVRRDAGGLGVLATAGGPIGGDRATELLIEDAVAPRLGSRTSCMRVRRGASSRLCGARSSSSLGTRSFRRQTRQRSTSRPCPPRSSPTTTRRWTSMPVSPAVGLSISSGRCSTRLPRSCGAWSATRASRRAR
ncbi:MAG: hypothetical protein E6I07_08530, partial [Chloroflexi bacterium]